MTGYEWLRWLIKIRLLIYVLRDNVVCDIEKSSVRSFSCKLVCDLCFINGAKL